MVSSIKGTRITLQSIFEYMAAGDSATDILEMFPKLSKAHLQACLGFASKLTGHSYEVKTVAYWLNI